MTLSYLINTFTPAQHKAKNGKKRNIQFDKAAEIVIYCRTLLMTTERAQTAQRMLALLQTTASENCEYGGKELFSQKQTSDFLSWLTTKTVYKYPQKIINSSLFPRKSAVRLTDQLNKQENKFWRALFRNKCTKCILTHDERATAFRHAAPTTWCTVSPEGKTNYQTKLKWISKKKRFSQTMKFRKWSYDSELQRLNSQNSS